MAVKQNRQPDKAMTQLADSDFPGHLCQLTSKPTGTAGQKWLRGKLVIVQSNTDHVHFLRMPPAVDCKGSIIKVYNKGTTDAKDLIVQTSAGGGICTIVGGSGVDVISDGVYWFAALIGSSSDGYSLDSSGV